MASTRVRFTSTLRADLTPDGETLRRISADGVNGLARSKAEDVAKQARRLVPVATGRLKASIQVEQVRDPAGLYKTGWQVTAATPYALFVHEGTKAHVIRPRRAGGRLRFEVGGRVVFASQVLHPGTRARPFLTDALAQVNP